MFVIPCKYSEKSNIINVIEQLIKLHPTTKILVIDSFSTDQSYMDKLETYETVVLAEENGNFMDSAIWFAYLTFPDEPYYFFLQDSMDIHANLDELKENIFNSFMWFPVDKELLAQGRGWHNIEQKTYAKNTLETNTDFKFKEEFIGLFGITFGCSREVLTKLYKRGMNNILPRNKQEMCASERLWGMCLEQVGIDITQHSINGSLRGQPDGLTFRSKYLTKYTFNRS